MKLEERFTIQIKVGEVADVGVGPAGLRRFVQAASGTIKGAGLDAALLSGGGDWLVAGPDGHARADIRYTAVTADGAHLYIQGSGLIELNEATQAAIGAGQPSDFGDHYLRIVFSIETGDSRYAWLNTTVFVSEGRFREGGAIEYVVSSVN
ncbi:DUF3237 domain-containing protein [Streptomyces galbus]|uniref:DUF3237 domain-containing protein n=1 Tax=Streptomyces galbus TaxID=33898 RepID=A0A4U5X1X5_STRGB|nr:DUF3237 domain-containing protein [Streptomyces galbus]TKT08011.1 DUF3237 domain-containing protein [Streptomyces galbus]GHD42242.1 hypothetical protein GCM10010335_44910 [Streptomyces galbus]